MRAWLLKFGAGDISEVMYLLGRKVGSDLLEDAREVRGRDGLRDRQVPHPLLQNELSSELYCQKSFRMKHISCKIAGIQSKPAISSGAASASASRIWELGRRVSGACFILTLFAGGTSKSL